MNRSSDWERRLHDFIAENRDREFAWGSWDCILMACAAAEAMTGEDKAAEYRGRYSDAEGAAWALRELGKGTLLKTVDSQFKRKPVAYAQRGDLVWFNGAVGICMGDRGLFVGEARLAEAADVVLSEGLIAIPRGQLEKAWAV